MEDRRIAGAEGAIVAGGTAARLGGIAKGLLAVDGETVVARTARLLRGLFGEVLLSANDPAPYASLGVPIVPDRLPGKGAPGGLHALLSATRAEWLFVVACDMPFVAEAGIRHLAARRESVQAVLVRFGGRLEPLHGFWSRAALPVIERLLREGDPSFLELSRHLPCAIVEEEQWSLVDPGGRALANVNTPEDAARLGVAVPRAAR